MHPHTYVHSSHANEKFLCSRLLPCRVGGGCSGSVAVTMNKRNAETILLCSVRPTLPPPLTPGSCCRSQCDKEKEIILNYLRASSYPPSLHSTPLLTYKTNMSSPSHPANFPPLPLSPLCLGPPDLSPQGTPKSSSA